MASLQFTAAAVFALLHLLLSTGEVDSLPELTTTVTPVNGITLTLHCQERKAAEVKHMEISKGGVRDRNGNFYGLRGYGIGETLAAIGNDNQIRNQVGGSVGVEGQLDVSKNQAYLSVTLYNVGCSYDGQVYCRVTNYRGDVLITNKNVTFCAPPAQVSIRTPDVSKPMRVAVRCDVSTQGVFSGATLERVDFIVITNSNNISAEIRGGNETSSTSSDYAIITGRISTDRPAESSLEVHFAQDSCQHLGEFRCFLSYSVRVSEAGSSDTMVSIAMGSTDNICDSSCLASSATADIASASLVVSCTNSYDPSSCRIHQQLGRQLSLLSSKKEESLLYMLDLHSSSKAIVVGKNYTSRKLYVSSSGSGSEDVSISDAGCSDAGQTYRCMVVYTDVAMRTKIYVADTTVPPCDAGALIKANESSVTCSPDPTVVTSGLLTLEISILSKATSRKGLALLNPYFNNGRPVDQSGGLMGDFRLSGHLDPANPAASYLTLTPSGSKSQDHPILTSCMVVYRGASSTMKKAFADTHFQF